MAPNDPLLVSDRHLIEGFLKACTTEPKKTQLGDVDLGDVTSLLWHWVMSFHDAMGDVAACRVIMCSKQIYEHARTCVLPNGVVDMERCRDTIFAPDPIAS